jgi:acetyl-CoA C-acetyltransferase
MAPAYAVSEMLQGCRPGLQDFDFYEIHEAFAAQDAGDARPGNRPSSAANGWGATSRWGRSTAAKLNVKGGSVAIGHPFAATGARIVATWRSCCRRTAAAAA